MEATFGLFFANGQLTERGLPPLQKKILSISWL